MTAGDAPTVPPKKTNHVDRVVALMRDLPRVRNISLIGHVDHGKTTLSDSLLANSGLLNPQLAGTALLLDYLDEEQERGITMKAANISLVFDVDGRELLVNLVDTPGHVDFSGKVTRALRLIDSAIVVVDAVEGIMIQTEHVVRQALENAVRPFLFINKIDRLINELDLDTNSIQQRFKDIISSFNALIQSKARDVNARSWLVDLKDGSVAFGSALHGWGATLSQFLQHFKHFSAIVHAYTDGATREQDAPVRAKELRAKLPLHSAIIDVIMRNGPDPVTAQSYRTSVLWPGNPGSDLGKSLLSCDPGGPLVVFVSKVQLEHGQYIATGRVFSGTIHQGDEVYMLKAGARQPVGSIGIFMGHRVVEAAEGPAGNIVAIKGLKDIKSGETLLGASFEGGSSTAGGVAALAFDQMSYMMEPVITVSIEPEKLADMKRLQSILEEKLVEDPNLRLEESGNTGEILLSGIGPLHLEVITNEIAKAGVNVTVSDPLIMFQESITKLAGPMAGTSTNGKNEIQLRIEPLQRGEARLLRSVAVHGGESGFFTKHTKDMLASSGISWPRIELDGAISVIGANAVIYTGGSDPRNPQVSDVDLVLLASSLSSIMKRGPLVHEAIGGVKVVVEKLKFSSSPAERDASEIIPMIRQVLFELMSVASVVLMEPIFESTVYGSVENMGKISSLIAQYGGRIESIVNDGVTLKIKAFFPVRTSFELIEDARTVTSGRAIFQNIFVGHEPVPRANAIIDSLRAKKGLI